MAWHFFPITLQYLFGGLISLAVTAYLFTRSTKNPVTILFSAFGLVTTIWMFSVFAARNAPSEATAILLYRSILFYFTISYPLLLVTLLSIRGFHRPYSLLLLPGLVWAVIIAGSDMFMVSWTQYGWSYSIVDWGVKIGYPVNLGYLLGVIIAGLILIRYSPSASIAKKYKIIIAGCLLYFIPLVVTNNLMWKYPWIFPIGGILLTIEFVCIAYAIALPVQTITLKTPLNELALTYTHLLKTLQTRIPGQALGDGGFQFNDFLEAMGLKDYVAIDSGFTELRQDHTGVATITEAPGNIIRLMMIHEWIIQAKEEFRAVLSATHATLAAQSEDMAGAWLDGLLCSHYGFMKKVGLIAGLDVRRHLPADLLSLEPGQAYFTEEPLPAKAYEIIKKGADFGIRSFCISKLSAAKLDEIYGVQGADIFWVGFNQEQAQCTPKDIEEIEMAVSKAIQQSDLFLILLDCFDQIKFANGLPRSMTLLKKLQQLSRNSNCVLMVTLPPATFEKQEWPIFQKEAEGAMESI